MKVDNLQLSFKPDAIDRIAQIAYDVNTSQENIGARRLHTVLEKLLEDISFDAPGKIQGAYEIDRVFVDNILTPFLKDQDLTKFIL